MGPLGRKRSRPWLLVLVALTTGIAFLASASAASADAWWHIRSETVPAKLPAGGTGKLLIVVSNLGDQPADTSKAPLHVTVKLPSGLTPLAMSGPGCSLSTLSCSASKGVINPYEQITATLSITATPLGGLQPVEVSAQSEGTGQAKRTLIIPVSSEPAGYGVEELELAPFNEDGIPATQTGSHPFQLTTTLTLNQVVAAGGFQQPAELPKDFTFHLPPGLIGNPTAVKQCTMVDFFALVKETNLCSPESVVGVTTVTADEPITLKLFTRTVPVFNLVPSDGEPARLGFEVAGIVPIVLDTAVRSGRDYGVDVRLTNATQSAGVLSSQVTIWGVPGDPSHDNARGWECVAGGFFDGQIHKSCPATPQLVRQPFLYPAERVHRRPARRTGAVPRCRRTRGRTRAPTSEPNTTG